MSAYLIDRNTPGIRFYVADIGELLVPGTNEWDRKFIRDVLPWPSFSRNEDVTPLFVIAPQISSDNVNLPGLHGVCRQYADDTHSRVWVDLYHDYGTHSDTSRHAFGEQPTNGGLLVTVYTKEYFERTLRNGERMPDAWADLFEAHFRVVNANRHYSSDLRAVFAAGVRRDTDLPPWNLAVLLHRNAAGELTDELFRLDPPPANAEQ